MAALAWNLKVWFAMMMHLKSDRETYCPDGVPALSTQHDPDPVPRDPAARGITLRLIGYQPTLDRLFSTWLSIERAQFT